MKFTIILFLLLFSLSIAKGQDSTIISPFVHQDMTITFSYYSPEAKSVRLVWEHEKYSKIAPSDMFFQKGEQGWWKLTVPPMPPDVYLYALMVNEIRQFDPLNPTYFYKDGRAFSLLTVPIFPTDTYHLPSKQDISGEIQNRTYFSKALNDVKEVNIYVPNNQFLNKTLPIIYLLHDENQNGNFWFLYGRIQFLLDHLIAEGKIPPLIAIMPDTSLPKAEKKNQKTNKTPNIDFVKDIVLSLTPEIPTWYPTVSKKASIIGIGLGAEKAIQLTLNYPEYFEFVGAFSGEVLSPKLIKEITQNSKKTNLLLTADALSGVQNPSLLHLQLQNSDIEHDNYQMKGINRNWVFWRHVLHDVFLPKVFAEK
jgi:enterochelin esterase family protein